MENRVTLSNQGLSNTSSRSRYVVRAGVLAAALALIPASSFALALGKVHSTSYLGERLSVEIPIVEATAAELSSLKASIASPSLFSSLGIDYHPSLVGADVSIQKSSDGKQVIRIVTPSAVNDPFVNLVVVATWSSGRVVRDYALLLDPPDLNRKPETATTSVKVSNPEMSTGAATPSPIAPVKAPEVPAPVPPQSTPQAASTVVAKPPVGASAQKQVTVAPGMTAGGIAKSLKPEGISLDQMLVALLQGNPGAFINGNVNLIRSGAVLNVPTGEQLGQLSDSQARKIVEVETKNFEEYKRRLAENAKMVGTGTAKLSDSGKVEPKVTDMKNQAAQPDKLLLSTAEKDAKSKESKLAESLQSKEDASRREALKDNLNELKKIAAEVKPAASASAVTPTASAVVTAATAASQPVTAPVVVASAAPTAASAPVAPSVAPVVPPAPVSVTAPVEEPSFISALLDNPLLPPVAGGIVALLAGLLYFRRSRQKTAVVDQDDSSFAESRLHQDSFFAESGGQTVDTQFATKSATTDAYTTTQLGSATDIDPIAEADVYLAYGRDMQAEEILKDAMVLQPTRLAIPLKLMELYAKHGESNEFEKLFTKLQNLTGPADPEWLRANELRKVLQSNIKVASDVSELDANSHLSGGLQSSQSARTLDGVVSERSIWFENDVSSSMHPDQPGHSPSKMAPSTIPASRMQNSRPNTAVVAEPRPLPTLRPPIEFDISALSLDLNTQPASASGAAEADSMMDPWRTKLALAQEYQALGDIENARKMLNEVLIGGDERVKAQAKALLEVLA